MAVRIHVVATRGTDKAGMLEAFSSIGDIDVHEAGGWTWFNASVWRVRGSDLDACLQTLPGPSMFYTTEDGARWYLRLYREGGERFATAHEFYYGEDAEDGSDDDWEDLRFEGDDEEEGVIITIGGLPALPEPEGPGLEIDDEYFAPYANPVEWEEDDEEDDDDAEEEDASPLADVIETYEELGMPLPDDFIDALERIPAADVRTAFFRQHAEFVCDALDRFGIAHNRPGTIAILTGQTVTEAENDSDIGNLPRLLAHLGLGPYFENMVQEMIDEADEDEDEYDEDDAGVEDEDYDDATDLKSVIRRAGALLLTPIGGGPISIPVSEVPMLFRAARYLDAQAGAVLVAECPVEVDARGWTSPTYVEVLQDGSRVIIGFEQPAALVRPKAAAKVVSLLAKLPTGTALELLTAGAGSATQRYAGTIHDGVWALSQSHPPLNADVLASACDLFRMIAAGGPIETRDDAEADTVMEKAALYPELRDRPPLRDGLTITATEYGREVIGKILFCHRYNDAWNTAWAETRAREEHEDWLAFEAEMAAGDAVFKTGRVVYEGRGSRFLEPNYAAEGIEPPLQAKLDDIGRIDKVFVEAGFEHVVDLVCERIGYGGILRTYVNVRENAMGVYYLMTFGGGWNDLVTTFTDGALLTTSNGAAEGSLPQIKSLRHQTETGDPGAMLAEHRVGVEKLMERGLVVAPVDVTAEGIAKAIDDFLVRRMGPAQ